MIAKNIKLMLSIIFTIIAILTIVLSGCSSEKTANEEESSTEYALDESYDTVRNGARLVLNYDKQSNSFKGFVENTTDSTLKQVRVEVHLSNGTELGPTDKSFDGWSAHPEVGESGSGEHGNGEEGNEHGNEGGGEHSGGNSG